MKASLMNTRKRIRACVQVFRGLILYFLKPALINFEYDKCTTSRHFSGKFQCTPFVGLFMQICLRPFSTREHPVGGVGASQLSSPLFSLPSFCSSVGRAQRKGMGWAKVGMYSFQPVKDWQIESYSGITVTSKQE